MQVIEAILFEPVGCFAEFQAEDGARLYEDVMPALTELKAMGIKLFIASSLPHSAVTRFLKKYSLGEFFDAVWGRDTPLRNAIDAASLRPERTMFLTDTEEGLRVAKSVGVNSILMMNDPDEAKRLSMHNPAGGIVSLHELPDFVRFVAARNVS